MTGVQTCALPISDWCSPCKTMSPILDDIQKDFDGRLSVVKLNIDKDENYEPSKELGIRSIPTLILYVKGEPVWRHLGVISSDKLTPILNEHLTPTT